MSRIALSLVPDLPAGSRAHAPRARRGGGELGSPPDRPVEGSQTWSAICALSLLAWLIVSGCGGGTTAPSSTPQSSTPAASPAPAALQGTWVTVLSGTGERVTLTLGATTYQITRPPNQASGAIAVSDDRIEFSGSTVCAGSGSYRWSLSGSSLVLTAIAADACPGRSEVLAGYTFSKSG